MRTIENSIIGTRAKSEQIVYSFFHIPGVFHFSQKSNSPADVLGKPFLFLEWIS